MRWSFFFGACVLAGYLLLSSGAPPVAVATGAGLAAGVNWIRGARRNRG